MSKSKIEEEDETKKWSMKYFNYAETPIKEWIADVLEESVDVLFDDYTGESDIICMTSESKYYKFYLSTESSNENLDLPNLAVSIEEFRNNPDFTKSASILFDSVMTVFKPITHTMSNLKSNMIYSFPAFNEKYMRFEMNEVNHLRYEKQGALDNIAKSKELIDKIKDKTEKEFTDIRSQLYEKQMEFFNKFNSIKDSDILARDEECKLQNEYYKSKGKYLYIIMEPNNKIQDREQINEEIDTIMNRMPEFGTKWEDPEEENSIDRLKKEFLEE
jgi:hypothetical protein